MLYTPDHKYLKAQKVVKNLGGDERDDLIVYYIQKQDEHLEQLNSRIKEYQEVFDAMSKFIKPRKPTIYG